MKVSIEETIVKINKLIDEGDKGKAGEIMQLTQAALNLAHTEATFNNMKNKG